MSDTVSPQSLEAVLLNNFMVVGHSPETSQGIMNGASSYSISLLMLNAVSTQYAGSQVAEAGVVTTCAGILKAGAKALDAV